MRQQRTGNRNSPGIFAIDAPLGGAETHEPEIARPKGRCRVKQISSGTRRHTTESSIGKGQESENSTLRASRLRSEFGIADSIGHVVIWVLLTIATLGLALIVFPYYLNRAVLNRTKVLNQAGQEIGHLDCRFNLGSSIGHVIIWTILIILTLGIAAFFYVYRVLRVVINETRIVYY